MTRMILGGMLCAGLISLALACRNSSNESFWRTPGDYDVRLVVTNRGTITPELRQAIGAIKDTAMVRVRLDSLVRDSVFGVYAADIHALGILAGRGTPAAEIVAGSVGNDRFSIELSPDATDSGVILEGQLSGGSGSGVWHTETSSTKGSFVVKRR